MPALLPILSVTCACWEAAGCSSGSWSLPCTWETWIEGSALDSPHRTASMGIWEWNKWTLCLSPSSSHVSNKFLEILIVVAKSLGLNPHWPFDMCTAISRCWLLPFRKCISQCFNPHASAGAGMDQSWVSRTPLSFAPKYPVPWL